MNKLVCLFALVCCLSFAACQVEEFYPHVGDVEYPPFLKSLLSPLLQKSIFHKFGYPYYKGKTHQYGSQVPYEGQYPYFYPYSPEYLFPQSETELPSIYQYSSYQQYPHQQYPQQQYPFQQYPYQQYPYQQYPYQQYPYQQYPYQQYPHQQYPYSYQYQQQNMLKPWYQWKSPLSTPSYSPLSTIPYYQGYPYNVQSTYPVTLPTALPSVYPIQV